MECTKSTIWKFKQSKPTLIVRDIIEEYPEIDSDFIYNILLKRGVFKWLAVRRDLIKLKEIWREEIVELNRKKTDKEKGYHKAIIKCREQVRKLCHSDRWRSPDFDSAANAFLSEK